MNKTILATLAATIFALGCAPPPEGDPPPAEEDAGPTTTTVTLTAVDLFADQEPMVGASVTLYEEGELLETLTTDDDGVVVFSDLPEDGGPYVATLHGADVTTFTQFGLVPGESKKLAGTYRVAPRVPVQLSGTVTGLLDAAHETGVFSYPATNNGYSGQSPDYSIGVPAGEPFSLLLVENDQRGDLDMPRGYAQDVFQLTRLEHAAITEATVEDLAFDGTVPSIASGDFTLPGESSPFFDTCTGAFFRTVELSPQLTRVNGIATRLSIDSDDRTFNYEAAYVDDAGDDRSFSIFRCANQQGQSLMVAPGSDLAGSHDGSGMLIPPDISLLGSNSSLYERIVWDSHSQDEAEPQLLVINEDGLIVWVIVAKPGTESVELPGFPPGVTRTELFGDFSTRADVSFRLCQLDPDEELRCEYLAAVQVGMAI